MWGLPIFTRSRCTLHTLLTFGPWSVYFCKFFVFKNQNVGKAWHVELVYWRQQPGSETGVKSSWISRNWRGGSEHHFGSCFNLPVICLSSDSEVIRKFHGNIELNAYTTLKPVIKNNSTSLEFYEIDFYGELTNSTVVQCLFDHAWLSGNVIF